MLLPRAAFGASPNPLFAPPTFREEPQKGANIAAYLKKYSKWWILPCVLLTLLTAFARNWLGAHTPQDVLVGMMIALVVLLLSKHLRSSALPPGGSAKTADIQNPTLFDSFVT